MTERELRIVATERVVGTVKVDGERVEFAGAAGGVFAEIHRRGGNEFMRRLVEGGWSNGYLYLV